MKLLVTIDGVSYEVDVDILEDSEPHYQAGPAPVHAAPAPAPRPAPAPAPAPKPASAPAGAATGGRTLNSPIPGAVVEINATVGQAVEANQTVMILDAMKMNTPIVAPSAAVIKSILVSVGDAVRMGQPLVEFE